LVAKSGLTRNYGEFKHAFSARGLALVEYLGDQGLKGLIGKGLVLVEAARGRIPDRTPLVVCRN
jgi:hypothetical protein